MPPERPVCVLDENFPERLIRDVLPALVPQLELRSWKTVDSSLEGASDPVLIEELHRSGYNILVTCDYKMMFVPEVLAAMRRTNFTVIGCKGVGDDPIKATGLLLFNLEHIAVHYSPDRPQPWFLSSKQSSPVDFAKHLGEVEQRLGGPLRLDDYD